MYGLFFKFWGLVLKKPSQFLIYKENGIQKNGEREKQREKGLKTFSIKKFNLFFTSASFKMLFLLTHLCVRSKKKHSYILKLILPFPEGGKNVTLKKIFFLSFF